MKSTVDFYKSLKPFEVFGELTEDAHYSLVPSDWWVVITDVAGSTKAISEGRYKAVNLVGASTIIAVINALSDRQIPYVFGGDGATILVHESDVAKVAPVLLAAQKMSKESFQLEIRAGAVPISELEAAGKKVEVAKFRLSKTATLAMVRGGGLNLAEKLIKSDSRYAMKDPNPSGSSAANFKGLSCRWNAIPAKRGEILSLLVLAYDSPDQSAGEIYRNVVTEIEKILGEGEDSFPITYEGVSDRKMSFKGFVSELRIQTSGKSFLGRVLAVLEALFTLFAMNFFLWLKVPSPFFPSESYVRDMAESSDFRKFDDMLRMVRDCSPEQRQKIRAYLQGLHQQGKIIYGMHSSSHSLMTCYVASLSDHVHFVDGSDGGYAMAAKELKHQMALRKS